MEISCIYTITCLIDNKIYIGRTIKWSKRKVVHKSLLKNNKHKNTHLQNAWNKYGESNFSFEILEEYEPEFLCSMENWWCNMLNSHNENYGYNIEPTSPFGVISCAKETKEKLSKIHKNRIISNETKQKMSKSQTCKKRSKESIKKGIETKKKNGYKMPELSKNKISEFFKKPIYQMDLEENIIKKFDSTLDASKILNLSRFGITNCLNKKTKTSGGFKWKFV